MVKSFSLCLYYYLFIDGPTPTRQIVTQVRPVQKLLTTNGQVQQQYVQRHVPQQGPVRQPAPVRQQLAGACSVFCYAYPGYDSISHWKVFSELRIEIKLSNRLSLPGFTLLKMSRRCLPVPNNTG